MRKLCLVLFSSFLCSSLVFAQPSSGVRALAIEQLCQYAQAVYDRGDYPQAAIIFSRILRMDPENQGALDYANQLKRRGQVVFIPVKPVVVAVVPLEPPDPNGDLKQDIKISNEAIEKLQIEITDLRGQIVQNQQEPKNIL